MIDNRIYETAVYCGALKHWRILNLNSGTLYSMKFKTEEDALNAIEDGEVVNGDTRTRIRLRDIRHQIIYV